MNALEMLGGFTASAGPIGGAETAGAAAASAGGEGGFEGLVAKALLGDDATLETEGSGVDQDDEATDGGADLSILIALAGGFVLPATARPDTPVAAEAAAGDAVDGGEGECGVLSLEVMPEAPPSGGAGGAPSANPPIASEAAAEGTTPSPEPNVAAGQSVVEAAPSAPIVTIERLPESAAPASPAAAGPAVPESAPEASTTTPATPGPIAVQPAAPETPAQGPARVRPGQSARLDADQSGSVDAARRQAVSDLREALMPKPAATSDASAAPVASNAVAAAGVARPHTAGAHDKTPTDSAPVAPTAEAAIVLSGGVVGITETSGQASSASDGSSHQPATPPQAAPLTGVRAEAAMQAFSNLAIAAAPVANPAAAVDPTAGSEVPAPVISTRDAAHNLESMVRSVRMSFTSGGGEARVQLNPEHLGPVTLTVRVEQGRVAAHIQAETTDASRWIQTHQSELRGALERQGLDVKEVVVTTDADGRRERDQPQQRPRQPRRTADERTPRFEVLV